MNLHFTVRFQFVKAGSFLVLPLLLYTSALLSGQELCPNYLFSVVDTSQQSLSNGAEERLLNLVDHRSVESVSIIAFNDLGSLLSGPILNTYLLLGSNSRCLEAESYAISSINEFKYFWAGVSDSGDIIKLSRDTAGYSGSIELIENDENRIYSFVPLSSSETALVKFDTAFMHRLVCDDDETEIEEDTSGNSFTSFEFTPRTDCPTRITRVLFLFTEDAANSGFDVDIVAEDVIKEINEATVGSNLTPETLMFELADVRFLPDFEEGNQSIRQDLNDLVDDNEANDLRDETFADIVILLVDDVYPRAAGRAKGISVNNSHAYAIATINGSANGLTATHEIGHLFGARHQKCSTCNTPKCDILTCHHGFPIGDRFRTIMYTRIPNDDEEDCGERERVGAWSSLDGEFMGLPTGNEQNNNARKLRLRAECVSCFRDEPPPSSDPRLIPINISGPFILSDCNVSSVTWTSTIESEELVSPVHFSWAWSENGIDDWNYIGSGESVTVSLSQLPESWFTIRLQVTDGSPGFGSREIEIRRTICSPPPKEDITDVFIIGNAKIELYPNPTSSIVQLKGAGLKYINEFHLFDYTSRELNVPFISRGEDLVALNLELFAPGVYSLLLVDNNKNIVYLRIIKF